MDVLEVNACFISNGNLALLTWCVSHSNFCRMVEDAISQDRLDALVLELRRGALVLAALSRLDQDEYGYSLKRSLAEAGLEIDEGTLYPLLRRLETQGLLVSEWLIAEGRPRRYYRISPEGKRIRAALQGEWNRLAKVMKGLVS